MEIPSYEFYTTEYGGGAIPKEQYQGISIRASFALQGIEKRAEVNYYDVKKGRGFALCALAEEVYNTILADQVQNIGGVSVSGAISSISLGSTSASFIAQSPQEIKETANTRYYSAIKQFATIYQGARWEV